MFKMNRCCDNSRPMYSSQESFNYTKTQGSEMPAMDYPMAGGYSNQQMMGTPMMGMPVAQGMMGCPMPPVYECPQERVVNREFVHNVDHIVPINTRIINHHIYRHSYTPCYTCCEENVCSNVYDGCPNQF